MCIRCYAQGNPGWGSTRFIGASRLQIVNPLAVLQIFLPGSPITTTSFPHPIVIIPASHHVIPPALFVIPAKAGI